MRLAIYAVFMFGLTGCSLAPEYHTPKLNLPNTQKSDDELYKEFMKEKWWEVFKDSFLNDLEMMALKNNSDFKKAFLAIKESSAVVDTNIASFVPSVNAAAQSKDMYLSHGSAVLNNNGNRKTRAGYACLEASYEVDLFAKNRNMTEASWNVFLATCLAKETVYLSLTSAVAKGYFNVLALNKKLAISKRTLATRNESFDLFKSRFKNGYCTELDLNRMETEVHSAETIVANLEQKLSLAKTSLGILVGQEIPDIIDCKLKTGNMDDVNVVHCVPKNIPSDLMVRRPDIAQAERELKAYNAKIGEARAAFFPSINLTNSLGYESGGLKDLFKQSNTTWTFSAGIGLPIFNGGKIIAANKIAKIQFEKAVENYKDRVKNAFKEAQDAVVSNEKSREIYSSVEKTRSSLKRSRALSESKYEAGLIGILEVLDVERSLLNSELELVDAKQNVLNSIIDLCKAIGGGWHK